MSRTLTFVAQTVTAVAVLALSATFNTATAGHHGDKQMAKQNIVATADAAGDFGTLLAAAKAAGLADTLANGGPFTVFAPTDAAFAALPEGTVESLLQPENKAQLATILKYHVVSGKVASSALADGVMIDTLANAKAGIAAVDGGFQIAGANIVATDIAASNGVIHVIDKVIMPPKQMTQRSATQTDAVALIDAAIDKGVPLFNHGNTEATAAIYAITAQSLLRFADAATLNDAAVARLTRGIERAATQSSSRARAWTLRYALDDVRDAMTGAPMQMARN